MKFYSVFVIIPKSQEKTTRISDFTHNKVVEVLTFSFSNYKYDIAKMLRSNLIVTVGNWHEDENCKKAVQIARIMEMEVIHESQFTNYVETNYN